MKFFQQSQWFLKIVSSRMLQVLQVFLNLSPSSVGWEALLSVAVPSEQPSTLFLIWAQASFPVFCKLMHLMQA